MEYFFIFFFLSVLFLIYFLFRRGFKFWEANLGDFVLMIGSLFLVFIAWLTTFPSLIRKRIIPLKIYIYPDKKVLEIKFKHGLKEVLHFEDIKYTYFCYPFYSVLILHKTFDADYGRCFLREYFSILGLPLGFGWKKKQVDEIAGFFEESGLEYRDIPDKDFVLRLFK